MQTADRSRMLAERIIAGFAREVNQPISSDDFRLHFAMSNGRTVRALMSSMGKQQDQKRLSTVNAHAGASRP